MADPRFTLAWARAAIEDARRAGVLAATRAGDLVRAEALRALDLSPSAPWTHQALPSDAVWLPGVVLCRATVPGATYTATVSTLPGRYDQVVAWGV